MDKTNMKNIIIVKNLPSNLVDEAIIVIKDKKKFDEINDNQNGKIVKGYMNEDDFNKIKQVKKDCRTYVVKEAEMVVNDYFEKIEENKNYKTKRKIEQNYKKLKYVNLMLFAITIFSTCICFIK